MTIADAGLYRTAAGGRLHIAECPHVLGAALLEATTADREAFAVCSWCEAELSDLGRTYHESIEDALRDMGAPGRAVAELTKHLRTALYDTVFVPYSRSYVALGLDGRAVAWAGKTYVGFRDGRTIELPGFVEAHRSGREARAEIWGDVCPVGFLQRSINGTCACCG